VRGFIPIIALFGALALSAGQCWSADETRCLDDAMLVFDASGSMAGTDMNEQRPHIAKVRDALGVVLPEIAPRRDLGLIVYGPGPHSRCDNVELRLRPARNSAQAIMGEVNTLIPAGQTPITTAVRDAAEALDFRKKPAVVVLLTDGEETCGGDPCKLARQLRQEASSLTIHVIQFKVTGSTWLASGTGSICMAEETGGLSLTARDREELVEALQKTLTCPLLSDARN
jgi:Ca-activated chloride channel homolog